MAKANDPKKPKPIKKPKKPVVKPLDDGGPGGNHPPPPPGKP